MGRQFTGIGGQRNQLGAAHAGAGVVGDEQSVATDEGHERQVGLQASKPCTKAAPRAERFGTEHTGAAAAQGMQPSRQRVVKGYDGAMVVGIRTQFEPGV